MTDLAIVEPSRRQIAARERSKPLKVTGRLKAALDLIAYDNLTDNQAAVKVGMTVIAIRLALRRPHVRAYMREQLDVLLAREDPRNIHRLIAIRDKTENMPAVNAIKEMRNYRDDRDASPTARQSAPGVVIQVLHVGTAAPQSDKSTLVNVSQEPKEGER